VLAAGCGSPEPGRDFFKAQIAGVIQRTPKDFPVLRFNRPAALGGANLKPLDQVVIQIPDMKVGHCRHSRQN
jgi:hypothetical protein